MKKSEKVVEIIITTCNVRELMVTGHNELHERKIKHLVFRKKKLGLPIYLNGTTNNKK